MERNPSQGAVRRRNAERDAQRGEREPLRGVLAAVLDLFPQAVVVLDPAPRVSYLNEAAGELERSGVIRTRGSALTLAQSADQQRLEEALDTVRTREPSRAFRLAFCEGRYELLVAALDGRRSSCAVFVTDVAAPLPAGERLLSELHDLTAAETRVATRLAAGKEPAAIARELFLSRHTVRAHLRSIFAKTGARNQADLVRLVLRGAAALTRSIRK